MWDILEGLDEEIVRLTADGQHDIIREIIDVGAVFQMALRNHHPQRFSL